MGIPTVGFKDVAIGLVEKDDMICLIDPSDADDKILAATHARFPRPRNLLFGRANRTFRKSARLLGVVCRNNWRKQVLCSFNVLSVACPKLIAIIVEGLTVEVNHAACHGMTPRIIVHTLAK
jgi:hypothetical protein